VHCRQGSAGGARADAAQRAGGDIERWSFPGRDAQAVAAARSGERRRGGKDNQGDLCRFARACAQGQGRARLTIGEWCGGKEEIMGDFRSFTTRARLPAHPMQPVLDPAGWSPADLAQLADWSYRISERDADELADGVASVRRNGVAVVDVARENFPLKRFADVLADAKREL